MAIIGERWSMVILRDMFHGYCTFEDFVARTGASRDILTTRLRSLEAAGIVERRLYNERPPRYSYHLTAQGNSLGDVMLAMMSWGRQHLDWSDVQPSVWTHDCGAPVAVELHCAACGEPTSRRMTAPPGRSASDAAPSSL